MSKMSEKNFMQTQVLQRLFTQIYEMKGKSFRSMSEEFQRLPDPDRYPEYYKEIQRPMSLGMIQDKLNLKNRYLNPQEFKDDMKLVFQNARVFNKKNSLTYKDATKLENIFRGLWKKAVESGELDAKEETPPPAEMPEPVPIASPSTSNADTPRKLKGRKSLIEDVPSGASLHQELEVIYDKLMWFKNKDGNIVAPQFQKTPANDPEYDQRVKKPMSFDVVRRKINNREYKSKVEFEHDCVLALTNARRYHGIATQIYADAAELQVYLMELIYGKVMNDKNYARSDRASVSEIIIHGESYRMGDWIHVINPNEPQKPIVAQVFRPWRNEDGTYFVYACWYYFPEQTVHQASRTFFEDEVFKTGHFHDHPVQEVLEKCHVLFITRYTKGRPRNLGDKKLYVCESRYSESQKTYTKIKSWNSCIPEELRGTDDDLEFFSTPLQLRRVPSPYASKNGLPVSAPPTIQGSHEMPAPRGRQARQVSSSHGIPSTSGFPQSPPIVPSMISTGLSPANTPQGLFNTPTSIYTGTPTYPRPISNVLGPSPISRASTTFSPLNQPAILPSSTYATPSTAIAPHLPGVPEIPQHISKRFKTDQEGKVVWYASPPLDVVRTPKLVHSMEYLESRLRKKSKEISNEDMATELSDSPIQNSYKGNGGDDVASVVEPKLNEDETLHVLNVLGEAYENQLQMLTRSISR